MSQIAIAEIITDAEGQHVTIPAEFGFKAGTVSMRLDEETGNIILSPQAPPQKKPSWEEVFAALDAAPPPDSFLEDRNQNDWYPVREPLG